MNKTCIGCGIPIQCNDRLIEGYVNPKVYDKSLYCERCFKLIHYGTPSVLTNKLDINNFINKVNKTNKSILYFIDILTISDNTIKYINLFTNKVYLVLTKRDLLPPTTNDKKIINYIKERTLIQDIFIISSKKNIGIDNILNTLYKDSIIDIYVIGTTNSGKSTFINRLLNTIGKESILTVSNTPNTTLEEITININGINLIDTVGFNNNESISNYIDINTYNSLIPKKEIKPKIHILKPNFMIILSDLIRIENNSTNDTNLVFYFKNELPIKKLRTIRTDRLKNLDKLSIKVEPNKDIVLEGLGFIKVTKYSELTIYIVNKNIITLRDKLM